MGWTSKFDCWITKIRDPGLFDHISGNGCLQSLTQQTLDPFLHSRSVTKILSCMEVWNDIMRRLKWAVKSTGCMSQAWFPFGRNCHKHIKITDVMEYHHRSRLTESSKMTSVRKLWLSGNYIGLVLVQLLLLSNIVLVRKYSWINIDMNYSNFKWLWKNWSKLKLQYLNRRVIT